MSLSHSLFPESPRASTTPWNSEPGQTLSLSGLQAWILPPFDLNIPMWVYVPSPQNSGLTSPFGTPLSPAIPGYTLGKYSTAKLHSQPQFEHLKEIPDITFRGL